MPTLTITLEYLITKGKSGCVTDKYSYIVFCYRLDEKTFNPFGVCIISSQFL